MFYPISRNREDIEFLRSAIARFRKMFGRVYANDNVILFGRNLAIRKDEKFMQAVRRHARTRQDASLLLRLNTLVWAAHQALRIPGDFVECGVFRGFCSAVVADYVDFQRIDKSFFLYDTFAGIPAEYDSEKHDAPPFHEKGLYESVLERFSTYTNVQVVRGTVPETFKETLPEQISFLHIDMNSSKSEIAALEVLFDRVSTGGLIVFDDYGWWGYGAQQRAEDQFMKDRGHRILELPTGQGLLVKQ